MNLLVIALNRDYEFFAQARLHHHLQVYALPHTHDSRTQGAEEALPHKPIREPKKYTALDFVNGRIDHADNDRNEREECEQINSIARPQKDNDDVEEGLESLHRVRQ